MAVRTGAGRPRPRACRGACLVSGCQGAHLGQVLDQGQVVAQVEAAALALAVQPLRLEAAATTQSALQLQHSDNKVRNNAAVMAVKRLARGECVCNDCTGSRETHARGKHGTDLLHTEEL